MTIEVVEVLIPQPISTVEIEVPGLQGPSGSAGDGSPELSAQFLSWIGANYGVPNDIDAASQLSAMVTALGQDEAAHIRPGSYVVSSVVSQTVKNPTWESDFGVSVDLTSATNWFKDRVKPGDLSAVPRTAKLIIGGTSEPGSGNHIYHSWRVQQTGATSSYEKDAHRVSIITEDPSEGDANGGTGANINKDSVAFRADAYVAVGNMAGRVWAGNFYVHIPAGADANCSILELDLDNDGSDVSSVGAPLHKTGVKVVTKSGPGTVGFHFGSGGGSGWYRGFQAEQDDLVDDPVSRFLELTDLFEIDRNGYTTIGKAATTINQAGIELDPEGQINVAATGTQAVFQANRTGTPSAAQLLFNLNVQGRNSDGTNLNFMQLKFNAKTVTAGAEDGELIFAAIASGSSATQMNVGDGVHIGTPTGGYKGLGTLNVLTAYYVNGQKVLGARDTGWTAMTGTPDEGTSYATGSVSLAQLAGRVMALQTALTTHGMIGA